MNKERKVNMIKALKRDVSVLKYKLEFADRFVKPLIIYDTKLKHLRAEYRADNRFIHIAGKKEADRLAKYAICNKISEFLKDDNIKKVVNRETDTTEYIFDFWVE